MFDRDEQEISQIVETGLAAIQSGNSTLQQFLVNYPNQEKVLRPEMEAAMWLISRQEHVASRPGFVDASRKRVMSRIKQEAASSGAKHAFFGFAWPKRVAYQWMAVVLLVILFFSSTGGMVTYAQRALPGEGLYPIKQLSENVAYFITPGDIRRGELNTEYSQRRLDEIEKLIQQGNWKAVPPTLQQYEQQVNLAVAQVAHAGIDRPEQKMELAVSLKKTLAQQDQRLVKLTSGAPPDVSESFQAARQVNNQGASAADRVIDQVEKIEATSTIPAATEPSATETSATEPAVSPAVLETPAPGDTAQDPDSILEQPTGSTGAAVTPGETGKKIKTPKPNNVNGNGNQPQKPGTGKPTPKPPKDNNPNAPNDKDNGNNAPPGKNK